MAIGFVVFGVIGFFIMPTLYSFTKSNYNRKGIEAVTKRMFGDVKLVDAITEEVCIISYDYNKHEPRLFSKYAATHGKETYGVKISEASEASAAAPIFFDPKTIGEQVLIDGGIIANNPAMYAYLHAKYANKRKNVRIVSIGTGTV